MSHSRRNRWRDGSAEAVRARFARLAARQAAREAACPTGKVRHTRRADAMHALVTIRRQRGARLQVMACERRVYKCPHCDGWHLTSKPSREEVMHGHDQR
jgi:hypothetical protein